MEVQFSLEIRMDKFLIQILLKIKLIIQEVLYTYKTLLFIYQIMKLLIIQL